MGSRSYLNKYTLDAATALAQVFLPPFFRGFGVLALCGGVSIVPEFYLHWY